MQWSYHSLALSHWYTVKCTILHDNAYIIVVTDYKAEHYLEFALTNDTPYGVSIVKILENTAL